MSISGPGRQRIASPAGGLRRAAGSAFLAHTDRGDTTTWDAKTVVVTGLLVASDEQAGDDERGYDIVLYVSTKDEDPHRR